jgi:hypothetical protein
MLDWRAMDALHCTTGYFRIEFYHGVACGDISAN